MQRSDRILVMTGGTSGFGRRVVDRVISERPDWRIVLLARRSSRVEALQADVGDSGRLSVVNADLSSLRSVANAVATITDRLQSYSIDAVALNAGVQVVDGDRVSADGIELTFAINHLAHFLIAERLAPFIKTGGRLVFTSSEVHDPAAFCLMGIARAVWQEPAVLADSTRAQMHLPTGVERGEARYSASKLLNLLSARHFARTKPRFSTLAFNPSVVPGTDIARDRNMLQILSWKYVMPILAPVLPGVRTIERSAGDLLWLLTDANAESLRGQYVDGRAVAPGSAESRADEKIAAVATASHELIARHLGGAAPTLLGDIANSIV
jgi:NAD(P)-dependent dehydrogenase (short-subunit alcohol dehydrogenase family)